MRKTNNTDPLKDDAELMVAIGRGSHGAFSALYDRYAPAAFGMAQKICRDKAMAEDVVQEAFLSVWRRPGLYSEKRGSVLTYLLGAVHHKAVDAIRHEESVKRREEAVAGTEEDAAGDDVAEAAWLSLKRSKVHQALQELSPVQREALELAYLNGLTYNEVAERLKIPLGTAKTRMRDGMIRLRTVLAAAKIEGDYR